MPASRKRPRPANDLPAFAAQKIPYVAFPKPYWGKARIGIVAMLAVFVVSVPALLLVGLGGRNSEKTVAAVPSQAPAAPATAQPEPYDITINASELQPPDNLPAETGQMPRITVHPIGDGQQHLLPPILEISVDEDAGSRISVGDIDAAGDAAKARRLAQQGDVNAALRLQYRALEREPGNLVYRLGLAILFDRAGQGNGAVTLYRQVVQAYAEDDEALPDSVNIDGVRGRLDYLTAHNQSVE